MHRWKCPDCGGWVASTVLVHHCEKPAGGTSTSPYTPYYPYPGSGTARPWPYVTTTKFGANFGGSA